MVVKIFFFMQNIVHFFPFAVKYDPFLTVLHEIHTGGAVDTLVRTDTNKDTSVSVTGKLCQNTLNTNIRMRHSENNRLILKKHTKNIYEC